MSAAVRAVLAGYRSYTAIAEWVDDVPAATALALGSDPDRRPSEAMIRRLRQALDADLLSTTISNRLATRGTATHPARHRAIAVDGKTLPGSRSTDTAARHVLAAAEQRTGVVLAGTDVDGKTTEITRFQPLLDQLGDLRDTVITVDASPCRRDHVAYLAERGVHWILTGNGDQPHLHARLAALPRRAVPDATRATDRGHGRREIRTRKILSVWTGITFPHAAQALQMRRRRHRLDQPNRCTTETVYAITELRVHEARPAQLAGWIRGHRSIENTVRWVRDVTDDEDRSQIRTGTGPQVMAALRDAAIGALRTAGITDIAAANRHHARDSNRPLALLGIT